MTSTGDKVSRKDVLFRYLFAVHITSMGECHDDVACEAFPNRSFVGQDGNKVFPEVWVWSVILINSLGGGFNDLLCSSLLGEIIK